MKDVASLKLAADGQVIIKGAQGITGTPKTATFTIGIILVLLTLFIVLNIINSRTGRAIMAIRDNRIAAESVGINITKYKLMAFTISASLAGVAGVLYAHNLATLAATPKSFGYNMSIMIPCICGSGRHRKYPWFHDRGGYLNPASGDASKPQ